MLGFEIGINMILFFSCQPQPIFDRYPLLDMNMIHIPAGDFFMGGHPPTSQPVHRVSITQDYWISDIELTQQSYHQIIQLNPSEQPDPTLPVSNILWTEALVFCNALSEAENLSPCYTDIEHDGAHWSFDCDGYRLPTEAEWEYAAKANNNYLYAGHDEARRVAWFKEDSLSAKPPRLRSPNQWNLYDMSGNVAEWVFDGYRPYRPQYQVDAPSSLITPHRISRGGGWNNYSIDHPLTLRSIDGNEWRFPWIGLRVARSVIIDNHLGP